MIFAPPDSRSSLARLLALFALLATACRAQPEQTGVAPIPEGEPERYSATVVLTFEEGDRTEAVVTRVARSGEMFREDWTEGGERRALILRPDLGKRFVLSLDKRAYSESPLIDDPAGKPPANASIKKAEVESLADPEEIERTLGQTPAAKTESWPLPDRVIEGHTCQVIETRAYFEDGRAEVTRVFRARDLAGLRIRVETESETRGRRVSVITERRDIKTQVADDEFLIPPGFVRVESLP